MFKVRKIKNYKKTNVKAYTFFVCVFFVWCYKNVSTELRLKMKGLTKRDANIKEKVIDNQR